MATTRKPLMAGNWKMNLNHLEAIALVQKLAFALTEEDYAAVDVAVLPPFTDIRSVQTLVDGDKYDIQYGAQDLAVPDSGAYTGQVSGADARQARLHVRHRRPQRASRVQRRDRRGRQRQGEGRAAQRDHPDRVHGRGPADPAGRASRCRTCSPSSTPTSTG